MALAGQRIVLQARAGRLAVWVMPVRSRCLDFGDLMPAQVDVAGTGRQRRRSRPQVQQLSVLRVDRHAIDTVGADRAGAVVQAVVRVRSLAGGALEKVQNHAKTRLVLSLCLNI